jgi:aryl-alcohol dehydrogenase
VPAAFIPRLVELYRRQSFPIDRLVGQYRLEDINHAAEDLLTGAAVKPVLIMG